MRTKEQMQIPFDFAQGRLSAHHPRLRPADEELSAGTPVAERRLGPRLLRMTAFASLWTLEKRHQV